MFLNLKSIEPYTTVASLPAFEYDGTNWWVLLSTISKFAYSAVLYIVLDTWQTPPP